MSGAKLSGDFAHLFVQRTNGLYPNVGSLDLRPGSIVKANKFGSHDLVATLDVRILEESTKHNAKSDHQHIATAMEITKPGPRCDAHNLRDCHAVSHDFNTEGVNVATGPCVSVAEGVADSEAHKRMICECDLALQFITQSDAIFSSSADTIFHAFSTEAMHNVWPIAEKYLHDGESLVTGAAWASTFVAFQAGTPGAVVGFKTKVPPDLSAQKLCDVLVSPDCKVHVHIGSVLQVAERNMVAMFAIKAK